MKDRKELQRKENSGRQPDVEQSAQALLGSVTSVYVALGYSFTPIGLLFHCQRGDVILILRDTVSI